MDINHQEAIDSIVLEEEIDPNYVPSEAEVIEYAKWLGIDLEGDKDLYWIPLPANWKPCKTKDTGDIYYFNFSSGESTHGIILVMDITNDCMKKKRRRRKLL